MRHPNLYKHSTSTPGGGIHTSEVFYKAPTNFAEEKSKAMDSGTAKNILSFGAMKPRDNSMYKLSDVNFIRNGKRNNSKS